jgi:hypothetical protein
VRQRFEPNAGDPLQIRAGENFVNVSVGIFPTGKNRAILLQGQVGPALGNHLGRRQNGPLRFAHLKQELSQFPGGQVIFRFRL